MRREDDKEIVNKVKELEKYEIKTTSSQILASYEIEVSKERALKEEKAKRRKKITIGSLLGLATCALAGAAAVVIVLNNNENIGPVTPPVTSFITPDESSSLTSELLTFASFNNGESTNTISSILRKRMAISTKNSENSRDNKVLDEALLKDIVSGYDEVSLGIKDVFLFDENVEITSIEETFTYNNETYLYQTTYKLDGEILATLYYNDLSTFQDDDEIIGYQKALYNVGEVYYEAFINQELEVDFDETEEEISVIFIGNNEYYKVSKETEIETNESENAISYIEYRSENDAFNDNNPIYEVEYSIENENGVEEIELSIKNLRTPGVEKESSYKNIRRLSENSYQFICEYERETNNADIEYEGIINLVINENQTRTYTAGGVSVTLP